MDLSMFEPTPEELQRIQAEALRGRARLQATQDQGGQYSTLAAVAQMANNPAAAKAAELFNKTNEARYKPVQMGTQGFMIPGSGEFVASEGFLRDKADTRAQQRGLLTQRQQEAAELAKQRAQDQAYQRDQDRALRWAIATLPKQDTASMTLKLGRDRDTQTQKYSAALEKAGVPEFGEALNIVEQTLGRYKDGKLPAYGRFAGALPTAVLDNEGQGVRADMAQAANILLKARSGAAVTESEMRRFLQEVATGKWMDEATLRRGWANVRATFNAKKQNINSGVPAEIIDEYISRGGNDFRDPGGQKPAAAAASADDELVNKYLKKPGGAK